MMQSCSIRTALTESSSGTRAGMYSLLLRQKKRQFSDGVGLHLKQRRLAAANQRERGGLMPLTPLPPVTFPPVAARSPRTVTRSLTKCARVLRLSARVDESVYCNVPPVPPLGCW